MVKGPEAGSERRLDAIKRVAAQRIALLERIGIEGATGVGDTQASVFRARRVQVSVLASISRLEERALEVAQNDGAVVEGLKARYEIQEGLHQFDLRQKRRELVDRV